MNCNPMLIIETPESAGVTGDQFNVFTAGNDMAAVRRQTKPGSGVPHSRRKQILIVDDELDLWWGFALKKLSLAGYEIDSAKDGEEAWQAIQAKHYDLLITDNKMPKLWGMELIKRLRDHGMALPIIFASTLLPVIDRGQQHYFRDVGMLEKPVSPSQLLALVEKSWTQQEKIPVNVVAWLPEVFRPLQLVQRGGINE